MRGKKCEILCFIKRKTTKNDISYSIRKFTKSPLASFLIYYFQHVRVSILGRVPVDLVNFFKLQDIDSSSTSFCA